MTYIVFMSFGKIDKAISGVNLSSRPVHIKLRDFFISGKALSPCSLLMTSKRVSHVTFELQGEYLHTGSQCV